MREHPPAELLEALYRMKLLAHDADVHGERLTGGVSSDIWRIDLPTGPVCVKRALAKLRVAADWHAPVERNRYEAAWMQRANAAVPGAAPALLGQDEASGALAMEFLPRRTTRYGRRNCATATPIPAFAAQVATSLARIHAATAADPAIAAQFPTDRIFFDIRLEPYLLATGRAHPDLASQLNDWLRPHKTTGAHWCTATSARRTSSAARAARCSSTRSAPGGAIPRSTSHSASTTCC